MTLGTMNSKKILLCGSALAWCLAVSDTRAGNARFVGGDTLLPNGAQYHRLDTDVTKPKQDCGRPQVKWHCDSKAKRTLKLMVNGNPAQCEYVLGLVFTKCAKSRP